MLLREETQKKYGYYPESLAAKSGKDIAVRCDYCKIDYKTTPKRRIVGHTYVKKDACKACKFKKREDVSMARDGVKNSAQRQDVREKMSDINWPKIKDKILSMYDDGYSAFYISESLSIPSTSLTRKMREWNIELDSESRRPKTMIERYGENYKQKAGVELRKRSQAKYGVDNPFQAEEIKKSIKDQRSHI